METSKGTSRSIPTRQLAPVTGAYAVTTALLALLGLVTTPYLLHTLGSAGYSVFALVTLMTSYLSNLEFGFGHATVRFLARARADADRASEANIIATSFLVFACCSGIAGSLAFVGSSTIARSYANFPAALEDNAVTALRLGAVIIALSFMSSFSVAILQARGKFGVLVGSRAVSGVLASASAVGATALFGDIRAVLAAQAAVALSLCIFLLLAAARAVDVPFRPAFHTPTFRMMSSFGVLVLGTGVATQVMVNGPPTVLAGLAPIADVAIYAVPALVLQQLALLIGSASLSFLPFASAESARDDRTHLAAVFQSHVRLTLVVMGPVASFLIVFADPLLATWLGTDFAREMTTPLRLLAAGALALALSAPPADVARGLGQPSWVFAYTVAAAVTATVVSLLTVGRYGATGAALGLMVGLSVTTLPFLLLVARRLLHQRLAPLLLGLAGPLATVVVVAAGYWAGSALLPGFPGMVFTGLLVTAIAAVATYRLVLIAIERETLAAGAKALSRGARQSSLRFMTAVLRPMTRRER